MKKHLTLSLAFLACAVSAQDTAAARAAYEQQQSLAEVPRLVQQFDLLVQNQDAIVQRLVKLESADVTGNIRDEVAALRAEIAELKASFRREQDAMRREIVNDLAGRISKMTPPPAPAPVAAAPVASVGTPRAAAPRTPPPAPVGPHYEYVVEPGQTLSLIAKGFDTTVPKILAANPGLKANSLRVGQKLIIPAEEAPKPAAKPAVKPGKRARR